MFSFRNILILSALSFNVFCGDAVAASPKRRFSVHSALFKVLSMQNWIDSQDSLAIKTPESDKDFVHFSTREQYPQILHEKFDGVECVLLTIDHTRLNGELKLEYNKARTEQYYHLYGGYIPKEAVIDHVVVNPKSY